MIVDDDGRIERFLEKPSWGQVFSDTINTGVYVLEPELLERIPEGEPYDFSKQLFPELLAEGAPLYGYVVPDDRYWQDIGTIEQYRQANRDVLDGLVDVELPGVRLKENIWLGEGVTLPSVDVIEGPAFLGAYTTVEDGATVGPYAALGANVTVKAGASVQHSVIDGSTHIGNNATVRGRDGRPQLRPAHPRADRRGRRARRRVRRGGGGADRRRRARVPVQDDRGRRADPPEPRVGVARRALAVLARRRHRQRQRRRHARGRGAARHGVRHTARARLDDDRRGARRAPGRAA